MDYKDKMKYLDIVVSPALEEAFKRGDSTYTGAMHHTAEKFMDRSATEDIRHIRELHADVRLREAEEAADNGDLQTALSKIESAIGYLVILHYRTAVKLDPDIDEELR